MKSIFLQPRYIREGFKTEKELAVFDLLSKDKTSITKGDIDKIKKVAQELIGAVEKRRQEMGDLRDRAALPATLCQRDGFAHGAALWLVTVSSWVEVWPEMRWLELFRSDLCCPPD